MPDWGIGEYELTAQRLEPAAEVAVAALDPTPGERVLDVACGTGNAALLAARAGAEVVGVDAAPRLVEVARARAQAEGLQASFEVGDAASVDCEDGAFDAAVSVFGVIFTEPEQGAGELLRVVRPGGRIVVTTWTTDGTTPKVVAAMMEILGAPPSTPRWSDPDVVRELFAGHEVAVSQGEVAFTAESPEAYVAEQAEHHPMWLMGAPRLKELGRYDEAIAVTTSLFAEENEDPAAFRTTSRYHVFTIRR
ncbi:MAG TPA: methyltransferase domain-containing protein [Solirubrobacteraceae bacterium]|jgi:SAM-dependent methyltransferase